MTFLLFLVTVALGNSRHSLVEAFYLPHGSAAGDGTITNTDDGEFGPYSFAAPFNFYGSTYNQFYFNSNNWILLSGSSCCLYSFSAGSSYASIATHGIDYTTQNIGAIHHRIMNRGVANEAQFAKVDAMLNQFGSKPATVASSWMFVLTYDGVQRWGDRSDYSLFNSWQSVLVQSGSYSYVIMNWENMLVSDGGSGVGFHDGNGNTYSANVIDDLSLHTDVWNTGCAGLRAFRVDSDPPSELSPAITDPGIPFTVATDPTDPTNLIVTLSAPAVPPAPTDIVGLDYEITDGDMCSSATPSSGSASDQYQNYPLTISGLAPYSVYTLIITSSSCGLPQMGTTGPDVPSAGPDNIATTQVLCNQASFSWDDVPCGNRYGVITNYVYLLNDMTDTTTITSGVTADAATQSADIINLVHGTNYIFKVTGITAQTTLMNPGTPGTLPFTTAVIPPPAVVTGLAVTPGADSTQLTVSWTSPAHPLPTCSIPLEFAVLYALTNTEQCLVIGAPTYVFVANTEDETVTITGLDPYSTYTVDITSFVDTIIGTTASQSGTTSEEIPLAPTGLAVSNLLCMSVTFSWTAIPCGSRRGAITTYNYELYEGDEADGNLIHSGDVAAADPQTVDLADLTQGTDYEFKVAATNGAGQGDFSAVFSVTTPAVTSVDSVTALTVEPETVSTQLYVAWTSPPHPEPTCPIPMEFIVRYKLTNRGQCEEIGDPEPVYFTTTDATSVTVTDLEPYSTYSVYITAVVGLYAQSTAVSERETTIRDEIPSALRNVLNSVVSCTEASFRWDELSCASRFGDLNGYNYIIKDESETEVVNDHLPDYTTTSVDVSGLTAGTTYTFSIRALSNTGDGPWNDPPVTFTTTAVPTPGRISNLLVTPNPSSQTQLLVSWTSPDHPLPTECPTLQFSFLVEYELVNRGNCEPIDSPVRHEFISTTDTSVIVTDLETFSTYTVYVTASIAAMDSLDVSTSASTTENAQSLTTVDALTAIADESNPNVLHISWIYPSQCSTVTGFKVEYELISRDQCAVSSARESYGTVSSSVVTIDTLEAFSTYRVYVTPVSPTQTGPVEDTTGTTIEGEPEMLPQNLINIIASPTSITISITEPPCGARNGVIFSYSYVLLAFSQLKRSTTGVEIRRGTIDVPTTGDASETLGDLNPCSTYELRVAAGTDVGYGEYNSVVFTTEEMAPSAVTNLAASLVGNTAHISWDHATQPTNPCSAAEYEVDYKVTDVYECNNVNQVVAIRSLYDVTSNEHITIENIQPDAVYTVWVTATNSHGRSAETSITVSGFVGSGPVPSSAPSNITYSRNDAANQVTFTWDAVPCEHLNGIFVNYVYLLEEDGTQQQSMTGNATITSVTLGIDQEVDNHFRVSVVNNFGIGPYSGAIIVPKIAASGTSSGLVIGLAAGGAVIFLIMILAAFTCFCAIQRRRRPDNKIPQMAPPGIPLEYQVPPGVAPGYLPPIAYDMPIGVNDMSLVQPWSISMQAGNDGWY